VVFAGVLTSGGAVPGANAVTELANTGLVRSTPTAEYQPGLAMAIPSIENGLWKVSPDGTMELTYTIRPGASWHDGTPVTANDAVFTATVYQDPDAGPLFDRKTADVLDVVLAPDERTIVARWNQPFINADRLFSNPFGLLPRHLLERHYAQDTERFLNLPYWSNEYVGAGPFTLREFDPGNHLIFDAFDHYVLGRPNIDVVEVRIILDDNVLAANLRAGTVHLTLGRSIGLDLAMQIGDPGANVRVLTDFTGMQALYPMLNPAYASPDIILDVRFRQALYYGLDRQTMVDQFYSGLTKPSLTVLTGVEGARYREMEAGIPGYGYDPRRAAQILEELGYRKGSAGFYEDASGQRLTPPVEVRSTDRPDQTPGMHATADSWQRLGVPSEVQVVPRARNQDRMYRHTRPGFILVGGNHGLDSIAPFLTPIATAANGWLGNNSSYANPELNELYDRFFSTMSKQEQIPVANRILRFYAEHLPYLPLYRQIEPTLVSSRLVNVHAAGSWSWQTWNAHKWDLK
jgi:peptide/nickel transport system substrate-binding protein